MSLLTIQRFEIRVRDGLGYEVSENGDELLITFSHAVGVDFKLPPLAKYGDELPNHRKVMTVEVRKPDHETATQKTDD